MHRMIGIVGGIGSYAGIDLIKKIYDHTGATCDQEHLPVSMLSAPHKVVDRTKFLLGEVSENPANSIADIISTLSKYGAEVIGIPCNTAHAPQIFEGIMEAIPRNCKLLHLVEEVCDFIITNYPSVKKVGVLSTTGTIKSNIYSNILSQKKIEVIHPSEEIQNGFVQPAIYDPIYGIKAHANPIDEKALKDLISAASNLSKMGAQAIILGCTEIPLALTQLSIEGSLIVDATSVLAKALIRESRTNVFKK